MSEEKKVFTQEQIDKTIQERIGREKRKHAEEIESIQNGDIELPEGETDYKQVYEENNALYFNLLKQSKLTDAGMTIDQAEYYAGYIVAGSEEGIETEASELAGDVLKGQQGNVKRYADPSQGKKGGTWNPFQ